MSPNAKRFRAVLIGALVALAIAGALFVFRQVDGPTDGTRLSSNRSDRSEIEAPQSSPAPALSAPLASVTPLSASAAAANSPEWKEFKRLFGADLKGEFAKNGHLASVTGEV